MRNILKTRLLCYFLVPACFFAGKANAALSLEITEYTSSAISFNVSGTFDADTFGSPAGLLLLAPSADFNTQWYSGSLVLDSSSLTIGAFSATPTGFNNGGTTGDSIYWSGAGGDGAIITAGTSIGGSARMTGTIIDTFDITDFRLFSGINGARTPSRLEATATGVPEPASTALITGLGALAIGVLARRRRIQDQ